ncbi:serine protease 55-like [Pieris napi]|uniref:serine protease 55-like n=1 Tax=Pieris napi TaxID=78633 RepID=UPI001FBA7F1D|nr:serine protease 55-like [Pieris napi]
MKTAIVFLIYFIICVVCDFDDSTKKLPKINRGVRIFNPKKFSKIKYLQRGVERRDNIETKKTYTVFSPISVVKENVPDSPYFNPEINVGVKPRVKKILHQHDAHFIHKRSADARKRGIALDIANNTVAKGANEPNPAKTKDVHPKRQSKIHAKSGQRTHKHHKSHHRSQKSNRHVDKHSKSGLKRINHKRNKKNARSKVRQNKNVRHGKVRNRRLIASRDAMIEDYPYVVSIQKAREHWCSGALLNPRLVITTANCIWKSNRVSRLKVRAGSRYIDRGGQVARIQEVVKHPYWSIRKNPDYDIGLLLLDRNIRFSDKTHAVDLPNIAMYPPFEDAWVTSWGAERRDGVFENKGMALQVYHARLMDKDKCNNVTQRFGVAVSNNFICLSQMGRRAPCTRDTGAPAVSDGILWGLASWGLRKLCGTERYPAMFSYLGSRSNLDFITNATHYLMSDKRHYVFMDKFVLNKADTTEAPTTNHLEY